MFLKSFCNYFVWFLSIERQFYSFFSFIYLYIYRYYFFSFLFFSIHIIIIHNLFPCCGSCIIVYYFIYFYSFILHTLLQSFQSIHIFYNQLSDNFTYYLSSLFRYFFYFYSFYCYYLYYYYLYYYRRSTFCNALFFYLFVYLFVTFV